MNKGSTGKGMVFAYGEGGTGRPAALTQEDKAAREEWRKLDFMELRKEQFKVLDNHLKDIDKLQGLQQIAYELYVC